METAPPRARVAFVGTFPPTQCGIATFTDSLRSAMHVGESAPGPDVIRVVDEPSLQLPPAVVIEWVTRDERSLHASLRALESFDVAIVQHEFGIFGGKDGAEVVELARQSPVPLVSVLHTVLRAPSENERRIIEALAQHSKWLVTQSQAARARLLETHDIDPARVVVIPHGAAENLDGPGTRPIDCAGPVVLTWGLVGPGKGIERGIRALARMARRDVSYVVVGQTHPKVRQRFGERYRESLQQLARELGVGERVHFDACYHDWATLRAIVRGADVVLLPYDSRDQVTSGVLVEALASAKPIVSTRFPHAVEALQGGAGIVVDHNDPDAMADALTTVIGSAELAARMRQQARREATQLLWPAVATSYLQLAEVGMKEFAA